MNFLSYYFLLLLAVSIRSQVTEPTSQPVYSGIQLTSNQVQPVYSDSSNQPQQPHTPTKHNVYPYVPYPEYNEYQTMYPEYSNTNYETAPEIGVMARVLPVFKQVFSSILKTAGSVSSFLLAVTVVLLTGGLMTTAICSMTPFCSIQFNGFGLSQDTVRSLITPDNISQAAALVNSAFNKMERMQRSIDDSADVIRIKNQCKDYIYGFIFSTVLQVIANIINFIRRIREYYS